MKKGFEAYETIGISIINFNFGGYTYEEADKYVSDGKGKWAICGGLTLTFVPIDYKLKESEYFVTRGSDGWWEELKT